MVDERLRFPRLWWYAEYLRTCRLAQPDRDAGSSSGTHMCEHLLRELPPLALVKGFVKAQDPSAPLQTVARHFELVHGVNVLRVHFDARSVRRLRRPQIEVFMSAGLEVQGVVAIVEVGKLR